MKCMIILLHGIGGSSVDWMGPNDYTHGHLLLQRVAEAGWAFCCYDLYGHGKWKADEPDFDPEYINDELWPKFIQESETVILKKIEAEIEKHGIDTLVFVSYSGSAIISQRIANRVKESMRCLCVMVAPDPARDYDDEYSLHNQVNKRPMNYLIIYGKDDQEINIDDLHHVFESIHGQKEIVELKGSHSIDKCWTEITFQRMQAFTDL